VMPKLRSVGGRAHIPSTKDGWHVINLSDIGLNIFMRRKELIEVCFSVDIPNTTWEQMLAMNWEPDLSSQWLPFGPEVTSEKSKSSSSLMMHVAAKITMLPGSREVYVHRHVVDCFSNKSVVPGRQGLLIVERSPDNWKTGGRYMGEFDVKPPSGS
ncbi:unnamed protein product, partial [Polarella glacialis]